MSEDIRWLGLTEDEIEFVEDIVRPLVSNYWLSETAQGITRTIDSMKAGDWDYIAEAIKQISEAQALVAKLADEIHPEITNYNRDPFADLADDAKVLLDGAHTNLLEGLGLPKEKH